MKKIVVVVAAVLMSMVAVAADVSVNLGSITVPSAAVADVQEWLQTQALYTSRVEVYNTYVTTNGVQYVLTNAVSEVDEMVSTTSRSFQDVIPESAIVQLRRVTRAAAIEPVRAGVLAIREARAQAAADAAAAAELEGQVNPVNEE